MKLEDHVARQVEQSRTVAIEGMILESPFDGLIVIVPCFCVQDTPDNPCPCKDGTRILVSEADIVGKPESIHRESSSGKNLSSITLLRGADVVYEQATAMKVEAVANLAFPGLPGGIPDWLKDILTGTPPTFPRLSDPDDPGDAELIWLIPVVAAAVGAAGGYLASRCQETTTTTTTTNADGTKTTTVEKKTCD